MKTRPGMRQAVFRDWARGWGSGLSVGELPLNLGTRPAANSGSRSVGSRIEWGVGIWQLSLPPQHPRMPRRLGLPASACRTPGGFCSGGSGEERACRGKAGGQEGWEACRGLRGRSRAGCTEFSIGGHGGRAGSARAAQLRASDLALEDGWEAARRREDGPAGEDSTADSGKGECPWWGRRAVEGSARWVPHGLLKARVES